MGLRVLHCFRAPLGGVFRHVCDLAAGQASRGIEVGAVLNTGSVSNIKQLEELTQNCSLGVTRLDMNRLPHPNDLQVIKQIKDLCQKIKPDIVHGHGAKGGFYARVGGQSTGAKTIYTPHGGSIHFEANSVNGMFYFAMERWLRRYTSGAIFESDFSAKAYRDKVGELLCPNETIYNALSVNEFTPAASRNAEYDFLFLGELRQLKGVDVLLEALSVVVKKHDVRCLIAGIGPDEERIRSLVREKKLTNNVVISNPIYPASSAFELARALVVPSRHDSFPYIVLEAAASRLPMIATNVGGIPEIFGEYRDWLIPPDKPAMLAEAMIRVIESPEFARQRADKLWRRAQRMFQSDRMIANVSSMYDRVTGVTP